MSLRVIGAGLPRTGTTSLKASLEQLLDGRCYHMFELFGRAETDGAMWWGALNGELDRLEQVLDGWDAAVDWPTSIFWRELAERHPDALVILSHRGSSEAWWQSANATVWEAMRRTDEQPFVEFNRLMRERSGFDHDLGEQQARARYDEHFAQVVETIPAERLLLWQPSDGWEPICERLDIPVPATEPPHANTRADFIAHLKPPGEP